MRALVLSSLLRFRLPFKPPAVQMRNGQPGHTHLVINTQRGVYIPCGATVAATAALLLASAGVVTVATSAIAQPVGDAPTPFIVRVVNDSLRGVLPANFCAMNPRTPNERDYLARAELMVGQENRLLLFAVNCNELRLFITGDIDNFSQALTITWNRGRRGDIPITIPRSQYLKVLAPQIQELTKSIDRLVPTVELRARKLGEAVTVAGAEIQPIGRDQNAVYYAMKTSLRLPGNQLRYVENMHALTLIGGWPITLAALNISGVQGRHRLLLAQQEMLDSLIEGNLAR